MKPSGDPRAGASAPAPDNATLARRKLLRVVCYVAPVVIGTFLAGKAAAASCDPQSGCNPNAPCHPSCHPRT